MNINNGAKNSFKVRTVEPVNHHTKFRLADTTGYFVVSINIIATVTSQTSSGTKVSYFRAWGGMPIINGVISSSPLNIISYEEAGWYPGVLGVYNQATAGEFIVSFNFDSSVTMFTDITFNVIDKSDLTKKVYIELV